MYSEPLADAVEGMFDAKDDVLSEAVGLVEAESEAAILIAEAQALLAEARALLAEARTAAQNGENAIAEAKLKASLDKSQQAALKLAQALEG